MDVREDPVVERNRYIHVNGVQHRWIYIGGEDDFAFAERDAGCDLVLEVGGQSIIDDVDEGFVGGGDANPLVRLEVAQGNDVIFRLDRDFAQVKLERNL